MSELFSYNKSSSTLKFSAAQKIVNQKIAFRNEDKTCQLEKPEAGVEISVRQCYELKGLNVLVALSTLS